MKTSLPLKIAEEGISAPSLNRLAPGAARWRWMALTGVAAGSAAVPSGAFAEIVQINQPNSMLSSEANTLRPDLTGDGILELDGLQGVVDTQTIDNKLPNTWEINNRARVFLLKNGTYQSLAEARYFRNGNGTIPGQNPTGNGYLNWIKGIANAVNPRIEFVPIQFSDARINGGQTTNGLLEIKAFSADPTSQTVSFVRLVFNNTSTDLPPIGGPGGTPGGVVPGGTNTVFDPTPPPITITVIDTITRTSVNKASMELDLTILKKRLKVYKTKLKKAEKRKQPPRIKWLTRSVKKLKIDITRLELQIQNS